MRRRLDTQVETTIYRVIQEALTNIAKYADVPEAKVTVLDTDEYIEVSIEDSAVWKNGQEALTVRSMFAPSGGKAQR
jgi:two-component system sensor histidine kinase NreB